MSISIIAQKRVKLQLNGVFFFKSKNGTQIEINECLEKHKSDFQRLRDETKNMALRFIDHQPEGAIPAMEFIHPAYEAFFHVWTGGSRADADRNRQQFMDRHNDRVKAKNRTLAKQQLAEMQQSITHFLTRGL